MTQPTLEQQAKQASEFLRTLGNTHRLLVLCLLIEHGEMSVGQILEHTTLSQSALSQHLAKMRDEGLISYRRQSQTLYYTLCDDKVARIIMVLKDIFCP
ncbi:helix-turn-helix transcriptional regulator [Moraxella sp. VT-16-12]|uniref:ArsR/SmtB family transcription factor n=1 Tax=Moraxella sp. VT-16-12 TaxID=2014877 RepID=UPI000B7F785F|nr:metalloregulator ArsR/SmtB family transcription factor [Moraxella sp. VT-16-12]TWV84888.1 helix-turn-helix transcriptional regulator [Moraxella sp. VT-16-12]